MGAPGGRALKPALILCTVLAMAACGSADTDVSVRRSLGAAARREPKAPPASYFDKLLTIIRNDTALLRAFLQHMPKGGDIHLHLTGSVFTETLVNNVFDTMGTIDWWICPETLTLVPQQPNLQACTRCRDCTDVSILNDEFAKRWRGIFERFPDYATQWLPLNTTFAASGAPINLALRQLWERSQLAGWLLESWSVYNYPALPTEPYQTPAPAFHFFNTFRRFRFAADQNNRGMFMELKKRAVQEGLNYLEVMYSGVWSRPRLSSDPAVRTQLNGELLAIQAAQNESALNEWMEARFAQLAAPTAVPTLLAGTESYMATVRDYLAGADEDNGTAGGFFLRIMLQTNRVVPPADVFEAATANFFGANYSFYNNGPVVGVNLVGSEIDPVALRDYWLHMRFFRFLRSKFPVVQLALHAGEIVIGMVPPEHLRFHIHDAIFVAGAKRIGHGVDIPHEDGLDRIFETMRQDNITIEINLSSNAFILGADADQQPNGMYMKAGVPFVISSDDPGILRTTLSEQFVLLLRRYPTIVNYRMLKTVVTNSISRSFLQEAQKVKALGWLARAFTKWEADMFASKLWQTMFKS